MCWWTRYGVRSSIACSSATPRSTDGSSIGYWTCSWQAPCNQGANNKNHGSGLIVLAYAGIPVADTDGNRKRPRSRLVAAHQHALPPGIPRRAPQPQRRGGDGSPPPLPRPTDIYTDNPRTTEPHLHQHRASTVRRKQRPGLGRHALPEHRRDQRCRGEAIANYVNRNSMRRLHDSDKDDDDDGDDEGGDDEEDRDGGREGLGTR